MDSQVFQRCFKPSQCSNLTKTPIARLPSLVIQSSRILPKWRVFSYQLINILTYWNAMKFNHIRYHNCRPTEWSTGSTWPEETPIEHLVSGLRPKMSFLWLLIHLLDICLWVWTMLLKPQDFFCSVLKLNSLSVTLQNLVDYQTLKSPAGIPKQKIKPWWKVYHEMILRSFPRDPGSPSENGNET